MNFINCVSITIIPFIILIISLVSLYERKNIYDNFVNGVKEGMKIVINLFPTLLALFICIEFFKNSGIIELIINILNPLMNIFRIPGEILPLAIIRPISGSGALAVATDILKQNGVDSKIGIMASVMMGSTETTLYIIAVYTSCVKVKKIRFVLWAALIADFIGMLTSVVICNILSKCFP